VLKVSAATPRKPLCGAGLGLRFYLAKALHYRAAVGPVYRGVELLALPIIIEVYSASHDLDGLLFLSHGSEDRVLYLTVVGVFGSEYQPCLSFGKCDGNRIVACAGLVDPLFGWDSVGEAVTASQFPA
jgi:hypothetical protein